MQQRNVIKTALQEPKHSSAQKALGFPEDKLLNPSKAHSHDLAPLEQEVATLIKKLARFEASQLRAVPIVRHDGTYYGASLQAIEQLIDMFSTSFYFSKKPAISSSIKNIAGSEAEKVLMLSLGNALLQFKKNIQLAEHKYFKAHSRDPALAMLRDNATWVICFHYTVEQYLDKIPAISASDYGRFIKNLQTLCQKIHSWTIEYCPDQTDQFDEFKPKVDKEQRTKRRAVTTSAALFCKMEEAGRDHLSTMVTAEAAATLPTAKATPTTPETPKPNRLKRKLAAISMLSQSYSTQTANISTPSESSSTSISSRSSTPTAAI